MESAPKDLVKGEIPCVTSRGGESTWGRAEPCPCLPWQQAKLIDPKFLMNFSIKKVSHLLGHTRGSSWRRRWHSKGFVPPLISPSNWFWTFRSQFRTPARAWAKHNFLDYFILPCQFSSNDGESHTWPKAGIPSSENSKEFTPKLSEMLEDEHFLPLAGWSPWSSRKMTPVVFMGYKSPFIKPFLNKTKKFTKENKRYRRMSCLIYSKKEKNKRGDTIPTCWTIKGSFFSSWFFFLIQNTSEGYTYLKQSSGAGMQSQEPFFNQSKAGFLIFFLFFFLCRYIQRLGICQIN